MANEQNENKSQQMGQDLASKPMDMTKKGMSIAKNGRRAAKIAKYLVSFIIKVIVSCIKWLIAIIGPYVAVIFIVIILLLLVIMSIQKFDIFQLAKEREPYEEKFDETVLNVMRDRLEEAPIDIMDTIRPTQPPPDWPPISEQWLYEAGQLMKLSEALPVMHHYYKNIKNKNYEPWHDDFSEGQQDKFYDIISDEFDYYYSDKQMMPEYTWGVVPIDEYIYTKTTTTCTVTDKDGNTTSTTSTSENKRNLPKRDIVEKIELVYHTGTVPYKQVSRDDTTTSASGNCVSEIYTKSELYLVDESQPLQVEFMPNELIVFLAESAPEGKVTRLVKVQDLEYALELGKEIDPGFPTVEVDFEGLKKCYKEKRSVSKCVDQYVTGGSMVSNISGTWYPADMRELYEEAANACGIDWFILAAVHGKETGFSSNAAATDPTKGSHDENGNFIGAIGHFQFMPATWLGWKAREDFESTPMGNLIIKDKSILSDLNLIKKYGGYGRDGDGDGLADPWNIKDAAYTAACYLAANGYKKGNEESIKNALYHYNNSSSYVESVYNMGINFEKGGESPISVADGAITYPTTGRITSGYGMRTITVGGNTKTAFHYGLDFGAGGRTNVPIVSVADGVVTYVGNTGTGWGYVVRVKHNVDGQEFETLYAHLDPKQFPVSVGQTVSKGQKVATMGNSGLGTGPHLHLEVHVPRYISPEKSSVNPATIIPVPPLN